MVQGWRAAKDVQSLDSACVRVDLEQAGFPKPAAGNVRTPFFLKRWSRGWILLERKRKLWMGVQEELCAQ